MRFLELAETFGRLEQISKRLEMRATLAGLLRAVPPADLRKVLYLSQGLLRPEYEGIELGVADSLARRAVALATRADEASVLRRTKASGDLGLTASELLGEIRRLDAEAPLTVADVYDRLGEIAAAAGPGSQETKVEILTGLLRRASPLEGKFLVRLVLGTLRVGVREMTILDALTDAFADGSKEARASIEAAFNLSSDLGLVAGILAKHGVKGLATIEVEVGRPIRPMLAEREPTIAAVLQRLGGTAALEFKYDGLRVQAHVPRTGSVRLFSRRLEEISAQFPELVAEIPRAVDAAPAIVEGECVPIDPDTDDILPFQLVSRRRGRKHDLARLQEEVPVCLFLFDVLLSEGKAVLGRPFPERRRILERILRPTDRVRLAVQQVVETVDRAQSFFDEAVAGGAEGVVAKSLKEGSAYRAGTRGFWWIKYKRDYTAGLTDSVDGVVVGAFHGRGRRAGRFGAFLLAVYDTDRDQFESFCKVGSGFDDAGLEAMPPLLRRFQVGDRPAGVETGVAPDVWFRPGLVLEVRGAELTLSPVHRAALGTVRPGAGLALRFPRFTGRVREDKGPTEATTSRELLEMYRSQVRQSTAET